MAQNIVRFTNYSPQYVNYNTYNYIYSVFPITHECSCVQAAARAMFARQQFAEIRYNTKAVVIQCYMRGWLARRRYRKMVRGIILLQSHVRRRAAKRQLKQLKVRLLDSDTAG